MNNDLKIAQAAVLEDISVIADQAGIDRKYLIPYGNDKAKVDLKILEDLRDREDGKLIRLGVFPDEEYSSAQFVQFLPGKEHIFRRIHVA